MILHTLKGERTCTKTTIHSRTHEIRHGRHGQTRSGYGRHSFLRHRSRGSALYLDGAEQEQPEPFGTAGADAAGVAAARGEDPKHLPTQALWSRGPSRGSGDHLGNFKTCEGVL